MTTYGKLIRMRDTAARLLDMYIEMREDGYANEDAWDEKIDELLDQLKSIEGYVKGEEEHDGIY